MDDCLPWSQHNFQVQFDPFHASVRNLIIDYALSIISLIRRLVFFVNETKHVPSWLKSNAVSRSLLEMIPAAIDVVHNMLASKNNGKQSKTHYLRQLTCPVFTTCLLCVIKVSTSKPGNFSYPSPFPLAHSQMDYSLCYNYIGFAIWPNRRGASRFSFKETVSHL